MCILIYFFLHCDISRTVDDRLGLWFTMTLPPLALRGGRMKWEVCVFIYWKLHVLRHMLGMNMWFYQTQLRVWTVYHLWWLYDVPTACRKPKKHHSLSLSCKYCIQCIYMIIFCSCLISRMASTNKRLSFEQEMLFCLSFVTQPLTYNLRIFHGWNFVMHGKVE